MTIKAIETVYKNFKFRSRLEARWAVCFDVLGVKWEYEPEGYELGDGDRYLPDFWLPEQKMFVEIKPKFEDSQKRARKVYLAGKMERPGNDWRRFLYGSRWCSSIDEYQKIVQMNPRSSMFGGHVLCGPYAIDEYGGHGYGHITVDDHHGGHGGQWNPEARSVVASGCKTMIDRADTVFAWIHTNDCYGTIAELGYAHARNKEIWIAFAPGISYDDMWFIAQGAKCLWTTEGPLDAFCTFDDQLAPHEKKCLALSVKNPVLLIEGQPDENDSACSVDLYNGRCITRAGCLSFDGTKVSAIPQGFHYPSGKDRLHKALLTAKQARFEYGETPRIQSFATR